MNRTTSPGWYTISPDAENLSRVQLDASGAVVAAKVGKKTVAPATFAYDYCRTLPELALLAIHSGHRVSA